MIRDYKLTLHDLLVKVLVILASKGEASAEESKEQDTTGPNVGRRPAKFFLADDLRRHVRWSAAEDLDLFVVRDARAETKVYDLDVALGIKHDILELDVSVANALAVAVLQSAYHLTIDPARVVFVHATVRLRFEEPVSGAPGHVLHHQDHLVLCLDGFVELRNVRVVQSFHEFDLTPNRLLALDLLHLLLEVYFKGNLLV